MTLSDFENDLKRLKMTSSLWPQQNLDRIGSDRTGSDHGLDIGPDRTGSDHGLDIGPDHGLDHGPDHGS